MSCEFDLSLKKYRKPKSKAIQSFVSGNPATVKMLDSSFFWLPVHYLALACAGQEGEDSVKFEKCVIFSAKIVEYLPQNYFLAFLASLYG